MKTLTYKEPFLDQFSRFARQENGATPAQIKILRESGMNRFRELEFPLARNEDWKFSNVAPLLQVSFSLPEVVKVESSHLPSAATPESLRLVYINGRFAPDLSRISSLPEGVYVGNLTGNPKISEPYLGTLADFQGQIFTALNTAFLRDGAVVILADERVLAAPVEILHVSVSGGQATMSHPRNLIVVGRNSQAIVVERYLSDKACKETFFTNAVTEIQAGPGAKIDHYKLQEESTPSFHLANTQAVLQKNSNLSSHYVALGGGWIRNEVRVRFDAEGSEATLNGLYLGDGKRHIDNFTVIDHARPHCTSHELYKGILTDQAQGVFNGKIFVRPDAQKTDAKQTNKVLLLSETATINTKPQLEIFADDVKCTHGATVGQLDDDALFYLRSRGLDLAQAKSLLTFAFANDVIGRIQVEPIRNELERTLLRRNWN